MVKSRVIYPKLLILELSIMSFQFWSYLLRVIKVLILVFQIKDKFYNMNTVYNIEIAIAIY